MSESLSGGASDRRTEFSVNGRAVAVNAPTTEWLVDALRDRLGLTGTHNGCDTAQCGACTVLLDGQAVRACSLLAVQCSGREVTTVEGLAAADGTLHPLQQGFVDCHGAQCGFCTSGMLMSAAALLRRQPKPAQAEIVDALEGNLCRCTGYTNIVASVQRAAEHMARATPGAGDAR